jgi:hypothetical protein
MTPDRRRQVEQLYHSALEREAVAQGAGNGDMPDIHGYGFVFSPWMDPEPLRG